MKQHKWHKEIKAWADGAEIEFKTEDGWLNTGDPEWIECIEYRIKPQPKEPQYLYVYKENDHSELVLKETEIVDWYKDYTCYLGKIKLEED